MPLPKPLLRRNNDVQKYVFGHVLIIAGSPNMLGAAVLSSLATMRMGAGLVTVAIPKSLNLTLQQKLNAGVMTLPLPQTTAGTFSINAYTVLKKLINKFNVIAIGPGLSMNAKTQQFVRKMIGLSPLPLVIDADALNSVSQDLKVLTENKAVKILTPHVKEMARLTGLTVAMIEKNRRKIAQDFAKKYNVIVVLKGHRSVIASATKLAVNTTGNAGMAKAGSGDVLTGMIAALLAQGVEPFDAARLAVYYHGKAADMAIRKKAKFSLIATDIIDQIPYLR